MWGPALLVAPNASDGGAPRHVWLPAGDTWYYFWDDKKIAGDDASDYTYSPATGELPIFVKNGAIVPRYPFAKSVKEMDKTKLELEVYAGKDGAFDLLEDDGATELAARLSSWTTIFEAPDARSHPPTEGLAYAARRSRSYRAVPRLPGRDWHARQRRSQPALVRERSGHSRGGRSCLERRRSCFRS
jgi:hypothetical protein